MSDAKENLNIFMREWKMESKYCVKILDRMRSRSNDIGAELRMHSFTVYCKKKF